MVLTLIYSCVSTYYTNIFFIFFIFIQCTGIRGHSTTTCPIMEKNVVSCFDIGEVPRSPGQWNWNWLYFLSFIFTFEQGETLVYRLLNFDNWPGNSKSAINRIYDVIRELILSFSTLCFVGVRPQSLSTVSLILTIGIFKRAIARIYDVVHEMIPTSLNVRNQRKVYEQRF